MLLLHLSDTHFGTERPQVVEALVKLAHEQQPQVVVLSGDVTQRARRSQFSAARAFVDRLGAPHVVVIPGNHDIPLFQWLARAMWPYAGFLREFKPLEPVLDTPELLLVSVKTTRRYRHTNGEVSRAQVDAVAQRLHGAHESQLRVVVVHQPIEVLRAQDEHDRLRGHEAAARAWAEAGADLVLGGHIHLPYVLPLHERLPGLARRVWAVQAGTAVSRRVREGISNSVNLLRWGGVLPTARCVVERWDYLASTDAFTPVGETMLDTGPVSR